MSEFLQWRIVAKVSTVLVFSVGGGRRWRLGAITFIDPVNERNRDITPSTGRFLRSDDHSF
jgi:hypothetical protein